MVALPELAPTLGEWFSRYVALFEPLSDDRSRSLSRSSAVRRHRRDPSMSPFWTENAQFYDFVKHSFSSFSSQLALRPKLMPSMDFSPAFPPGTYSLSSHGIRFWRAKAWITVREFDSIDLLVDFGLRSELLYFSILPFSS
jgi:hypothetical protein